MFSYDFLLMACAGLASGQFVKQPNGFLEREGFSNVTIRYKNLPAGICEHDPNVRSMSGYADVSENQHIFWWFFEARNGHPEEAPLTLWINGGPGSSSMNGLFGAVGPCSVNSTGYVEDNPYSWSADSNMLFIDQPAQVGFSYSEPVPAFVDQGSFVRVVELSQNACPDDVDAAGSFCGTHSRPDLSLTANSTENAADNMWKTLQGFYGAFPQYTNAGLNFATESYGGHYAPIFCDYILTQNEMGEGHHIDLNTVLIGNGWIDPVVQYPAFVDFAKNHMSLNESTLDRLYSSLPGCVEQLQLCAALGYDSICRYADNFCHERIEQVALGTRYTYDIRKEAPANPLEPIAGILSYINTEMVHDAIGAYVNNTVIGFTTQFAFDSTGDNAREAGTLAAIRRLLESNVRVVLYFGEEDYACNWVGGEMVANSIDPSLIEAGFEDLVVDGCHGGTVKKADNISFVKIPESGHVVPHDQPKVSLEMFRRAIGCLDIASGTTVVC